MKPSGQSSMESGCFDMEFRMSSGPFGGFRAVGRLRDGVKYTKSQHISNSSMNGII